VTSRHPKLLAVALSVLFIACTSSTPPRTGGTARSYDLAAANQAIDPTTTTSTTMPEPTTTTTTLPAPTVTRPRPAPPAATPGPVADTIRSVFGNEGEAAIRVADCESSLDPTAVSPGGGNWGLFQINTVHRDDFEAVTGQPWSAVLDAYWNSVYAKKLHDREGWGPWACGWAA
jgi:hypothetical protein